MNDDVEDDDEDDGLNHAAPTNDSQDGSEEAIEPSTADHNSLTMGRGSSLGSGKLLPPPAVAPPAPPSASPSAPTVAPSPPVAIAAKKRVAKPVTDPEEALITAEPEMLSCRITPEDEFILLACDGLFDVFSSDEVSPSTWVFCDHDVFSVSSARGVLLWGVRSAAECLILSVRQGGGVCWRYCKASRLLIWVCFVLNWSQQCCPPSTLALSVLSSASLR